MYAWRWQQSSLVSADFVSINTCSPETYKELRPSGEWEIWKYHKVTPGKMSLENAWKPPLLSVTQFSFQ